MPEGRRRRVVFTAPAERDLDDIFRYLARRDVAVAERQLLDIIESCRSLNLFAERGTPRPKIAHSVRQLVIGSYLAFYRVTNGTVEIARVLHGKRDISDEF